MSRSLERHLSRTLALVIVLAGLIAVAVSFGFAYADAKEFQDDTLRKIAVVADTNRIQEQARIDNSVDQMNGADSNPEDRVIIVRLLLSSSTRNDEGPKQGAQAGG